MSEKDPPGTPLTQVEVDLLPEGAHVVVRWSGGNGPFPYTVSRDKWGAVRVNNGRDRLDGVGPRQPFTQVWSVEPERREGGEG